jgi:uncharacterized protein (DUF2132 family)
MVQWSMNGRVLRLDIFRCAQVDDVDFDMSKPSIALALYTQHSTLWDDENVQDETVQQLALADSIEFGYVTRFLDDYGPNSLQNALIAACHEHDESMTAKMTIFTTTFYMWLRIKVDSMQWEAFDCEHHFREHTWHKAAALRTIHVIKTIESQMTKALLQTIGRGRPYARVP